MTLKLKTPLVGYHGELKVILFHNTRIIKGLYYPKKVKGYLLYYEEDLRAENTTKP